MSGTTVTAVDRRQCKRTKEMKVLCLGLSRTGTNSLRRSLQMLGFDDTYHGFSCWFENTRDFEMWIPALEAKFKGKGKPFGREEFDQLLGHCEAVTDMPANLFAEELIKAYPEAKIVITRRDVDAWYKSMLTALYPALGISFWIDLFVPLVPSYSIARKGGMMVWQCQYGNDFPNTGRTTYYQHYADLEQHLPKDPAEREARVLEYDVSQGWDPLCKFLEVPVPKESYPRGNDMAAIKDKILARRKIVVREAIANGTTILAGVTLVAACFRYYRRSL